MSTQWLNHPADPAGKIQVNRFNKLWRKLCSEHNCITERWGTLGGEEYSSDIWSPFGHNTRADVAAIQTAIGEAFSWTLTSRNAAAVCKQIEAELPALRAARPVKDQRKTAEQKAVEAEERRVAEEERVAKQRASELRWVELYGIPEAPDYEAPGGYKVVTVSLKFNNSDCQSDYFDTHAPLSPYFGVMTIPLERRETEKLARFALAALPDEFLRLSWEWNVERYSMGHGCYLQSEAFELSPEVRACIDRKDYRGEEIESGYWEIQFSGSRCCFKARLAADVGNIPTEEASESAAGVEVTLNQDKGGVEVRFPDRPSDSILSQLKSAGFRWSRFSRCWYKPQSAESIAFARRLAGEEVDLDKLRAEESDRCAGEFAAAACDSAIEQPRSCE